MVVGDDVESNCGKIVKVKNVVFNGGGLKADIKSLYGVRPCLVVGEDIENGIYYMIPLSTRKSHFDCENNVLINVADIDYYDKSFPAVNCYVKVTNMFTRNISYLYEAGVLNNDKYMEVLLTIKQHFDKLKNLPDNGEVYCSFLEELDRQLGMKNAIKKCKRG